MGKGRYTLENDIFGEKVVYHYSWIKELVQADCATRFHLAGKHEIDISDKDAIKRGNTFESHVFWNRGEKVFTRGKGFEEVRRVATWLRESYLGYEKGFIDVLKDSKAHLWSDKEGVVSAGASSIWPKITLDMGKYGIGGELDFVGTVHFENGKGIRAIVDLKCTKSIDWSSYFSPELQEVQNLRTTNLQGVFYSYLWYKATGELLPFVRLVATTEFQEKPLVYSQVVHISQKDFEWLESVLEYAHSIYTDLEMYGKSDLIDDSQITPSIERCKANKQECPYMQHCKRGRLWKLSNNPILTIKELE